MALDFPLPNASPWTDPNGQVWIHNGDAWVRSIIGSGIEEAPIDERQYARQDADWAVLAPDVWYLGPFSVPPLLDNYGSTLQVGQTYFNTVTEIMMSWTGDTWLPFAPTLIIFGLTQYTFNLTSGLIAGTPLTGNDVYGNTPNGWVEGTNIITVYVNGLRQIYEVDNAVLAGDFTVDYPNSQITPVNTDFPVGAEVVIQVSYKDSRNFIAEDDTDTTNWLFVLDNDDLLGDPEPPVSEGDPVVNPILPLATQRSVKAYIDNTTTNTIGSYKNKIINGDFRVNQRNFSGVWDNSFIGKYGYDRWKLNNDALSILQTIEKENIVTGTYILSWVGHTNNNVDITQGGISTIISDGDNFAICSLTGNTDVVIQVDAGSTFMQLEAGSAVTTFETRNIQQELAMCQRFYIPDLKMDFRVWIQNHWDYQSINIPVPMQRNPDLTYTTHLSGTDTAADWEYTYIEASNADKVNAYFKYKSPIASAAGHMYILVTLDAEF